MSRTQRSLQLAAFADGEIAPAHRSAVEDELSRSEDARREVETLRSLRSGLNRVFTSDGAPHALAERIRSEIRSDRRRASGRVWRIGLASTFAAAAVVLMAVRLVGPEVWNGPTSLLPPVASRTVPIGDVFRLHLACSVQGGIPHDAFKVAQKPVAEANRLLRQLKVMPKADARLPDLTSAGYSLASACECAPEKNCEAVHAAYQSARGGKTVSLWIVDRPLTLGVDPGAKIVRRNSAEREYEAVELSGGFSVLRWNENYASVVLCGNMPLNDLIQLADTIKPFAAAARGPAASHQPAIAVMEFPAPTGA